MTEGTSSPPQIDLGRTARKALVVGLAVIVVTWAVLGSLRTPELPDFEVTGDPVALPAEGSLPAASLDEFRGMLVSARGKVVVVNIWASWCAPCRTEMPLLQSAADVYADDVVILGVASNDGLDEARAFLEDLGLSYPNVFDVSGRIRVALGATAYPTTYVFDATGAVRSRVNGGISEQRLAGLIEDALG